MKRFGAVALPLSTILLSVLLGTSCGGASPKGTAFGLPGAPPQAGPVNSYVGKPGNSPSDSSLWGVTINRSNNTYTYGPLDASAPPTTGSFASLNGGFMVLLNENGYQSGLALEIPGQAIVLRPGNSATSLVYAVQQASCFSIGGNVKFLFSFSPGLIASSGAVFGRTYASTNSDGSSWQFNNQTQYQAPDGKNVPAAADFPGYPSSYSGACTASNGSATVASAPLSYFSNNTSYPLPSQYVISPAGFLFANQSYANVPPALWPYPNVSVSGVSEPLSQLSIKNVATANYVGFLLEANASSGTYRSQVVGFGNAPISGTSMIGGTFPNEDPSAGQLGNMRITFGSQDPLNNGLYYLAKLTIPYDGGMTTCPTPLPSANGALACTYNAIATVGQPIGSYAIMLTAFDPNGNQKTLVLFEQ